MNYNLTLMLLVAPLFKDFKFGKSLKIKHFRDFLFSSSFHIFSKTGIKY